MMVVAPSTTMNNGGHSVIVRLLGREKSGVAKARPSLRMIARPNQGVASWIKQHLLKVDHDGWLLNVVSRLNHIRNRSMGCCMVCCGGGHDIVVCVNDTAIPQDILKIPKIHVNVTLAIEKGHFSEDNLMERYGSSGPNDCLWDHIDGALTSGGYILGDCSVFIDTDTESYGMFRIQGDIQQKTLIRLQCDSGTWNCTNVTKQEMTQEQFDRLTHRRQIPKKPVPISKTAEIAHETQEADKEDDILVVKKIAAAQSTCFYAPYCMLFASDCGGKRKGLCRQVNNGLISIPDDTNIFLAAKNKYRADLKKLRRVEKRKNVTDTALEVTTPVMKRLKKANASVIELKSGSESTVTESQIKDNQKAKSGPFFYPRQYVILWKAYEERLSSSDFKTSGEIYNAKDVESLRDLFNAIQSGSKERKEPSTPQVKDTVKDSSKSKKSATSRKKSSETTPKTKKMGTSSFAGNSSQGLESLTTTLEENNRDLPKRIVQPPLLKKSKKTSESKASRGSSTKKQARSRGNDDAKATSTASITDQQNVNPKSDGKNNPPNAPSASLQDKSAEIDTTIQGTPKKKRSMRPRKSDRGTKGKEGSKNDKNDENTRAASGTVASPPKRRSGRPNVNAGTGEKSKK